MKTPLDTFTDATHHSKSFLATKPTGNSVEINEWQVQEIKQAIGEADKGEFANEEMVTRAFAKWGTGNLLI